MSSIVILNHSGPGKQNRHEILIVIVQCVRWKFEMRDHVLPENRAVKPSVRVMWTAVQTSDLWIYESKQTSSSIYQFPFLLFLQCAQCELFLASGVYSRSKLCERRKKSPQCNNTSWQTRILWSCFWRTLCVTNKAQQRQDNYHQPSEVQPLEPTGWNLSFFHMKSTRLRRLQSRICFFLDKERRHHINSDGWFKFKWATPEYSQSWLSRSHSENKKEKGSCLGLVEINVVDYVLLTIKATNEPNSNPLCGGNQNRASLIM